MLDIIKDLCVANRAAVTKLIPRARRLAHIVVDGPEARRAQLREMAQALYIAERAERAGAIDWQWMDEDIDVDFGDCEPMAEGTYDHMWLHLVSRNRGDQDTIDTLGGIIIPRKGEWQALQQYQDEMAVENRDAIAAALLGHARAQLDDTQ